MNSAERVQAAFEKRTVDRAPLHHVGFCSEAASVILGRQAYVGGGIQRWREATALWNGPDAHAEFVERSYRDALALALAVSNDMLRLTYWRMPTKPTRRISENIFAYEYGPEADWTVLEYDPPTEQVMVRHIHPQRPPTLDDLDRRTAAALERVGEYEPSEAECAFEFRAMREMGEGFAIRIGACAIGLPHETEWLEALLLRPEVVARHLEVQVRRAEKRIAFLAKRGFRYMFGGYDMASQEAPMLSPRTVRELLAPALRRVTDACEAVGAYHLFASDGNLWPVADVLFGEAGIHGYYEIDRRAGMDLRRLRERYPHLTLLGNIASQTVHMGTPEAIREEVRDCLESAREFCGVIVGISNYVVPGTPPRNTMALVEAVAEFNR